MPHRTHCPICREQQVDGLVLSELQEGAELLPGPMLRRKRALEGHKVVENAVEFRLPFLRRKVRWRREANVGKQRLNENIVCERIDEEDRVVGQRVVKGMTVRLIFQKSFPLDAENLQPDAGDRPKELIPANMIGPI